MKSSGRRAREGQLQEGAAAGHIGPQRRGAGDAAAAPGARDQGFPGGAKGKGPAAREPERERTPRAPLRPRGPAAAGGRGLGPAGGDPGLKREGGAWQEPSPHAGEQDSGLWSAFRPAATGPGGRAAPTDINAGGQADGPMGTCRGNRLVIYSVVSGKQEVRPRAGLRAGSRLWARRSRDPGGRRREQSCAALGSTGAWAGTVSLK